MSENSLPQTITEDGYGLGSETLLMIPRGTPNLPSIKMDMTEVYRIIGRTSEIERVTPATYGELVTDFNMGMIQLNRIIGIIELELGEAENWLEMAQATALLERVEERLKLKNVKSSTDTREAAVKLDPEVIEATRKRDALKAISSYVGGLKHSLDRAYYSAKEVTGFTSKDPYLNKNTGGNNGRK